MEYPCYRCQASIEEGVTFCPHCGAPQIRVIAPQESIEASAPAEAPSFPQPATQTSWPQGAQYPPQPARTIQWDSAWKGALLAGVAAGFLSIIPFINLATFLWLLGAGVLSVSSYQRRLPGAVVTPGMGMRLGAVAGAVAFVISAAWTALSFIIFRLDFGKAMREQMEKSMARNSDPQGQAVLQRMLDWVGTPQGVATIAVLAIVVMAVFFLLFAAAGGALGASMSGKKRQLR